MLREVGRKATFYMLKYVKNNCKGGKNMDNTRRMNITVRQSRQSGVARATCPD